MNELELARLTEDVAAAQRRVDELLEIKRTFLPVAQKQLDEAMTALRQARREIELETLQARIDDALQQQETQHHEL
jgi:hypothetical protein